MKYRVVFIDSFTEGLDELPRRQQSDPAAVLRHLARVKRFSIFEATATPSLAKTMDHLFGRSKPGEKWPGPPKLRDVGGAYPWTYVELTDEGKAFLRSAGESDGA